MTADEIAAVCDSAVMRFFEFYGRAPSDCERALLIQAIEAYVLSHYDRPTLH